MSRETSVSSQPIEFKTSSDEKICIKGKIWFFETDTEFQIVLLFLAHCENAGHIGSHSTCNILLEKFFWKNMIDDPLPSC